jgi:hypothetical protein
VLRLAESDVNDCWRSIARGASAVVLVAFFSAASTAQQITPTIPRAEVKCAVAAEVAKMTPPSARMLAPGE